MGFAPKGLKKGDTFIDCGITYRVLDVVGDDRYVSEIAKEEPKLEEPKQEEFDLSEEALAQEDEKDLSELPFSDVEAPENVEAPEKKIRHRK